MTKMRILEEFGKFVIREYKRLAAGASRDEVPGSDRAHAPHG